MSDVSFTVRPLEAIFTKRSRTIYAGMKERAEKQYEEMPFTLAEFRDWLRKRFAPSGATICDYSGQYVEVEKFSVDHKTPISRGGTFYFENLSICKPSENLRKGNMTAEEYYQFKQAIKSLPFGVQESIFKRLEIGDVQRFSHFRRINKKARRAQ